MLLEMMQTKKPTMKLTEKQSKKGTIVRFLNAVLILSLTLGLISGAGPSVAHAAGLPTISDSFNDDVPISRALVARMLALTFGDEIVFDREISFLDTDASKWYDSYINTLVILGLVPDGDYFRPEQNLTLAEAQDFILKLNSSSRLKIAMDDSNKDKDISLALWVDLYIKLLNELDPLGFGALYGVSQKHFTVLATRSNNSSLNAWALVTDVGPMTHGGINMDPYIDTEVRVLAKDEQILAVLAIESETPTIKNAYVVAHTAESITIFSGGAERSYTITANTKIEGEGKIVDCSVWKGEVLNLNLYGQTTSGIIKRVTKDKIEFSERSLPLDDPFKVYDVSGSVKWKAPVNLVVGTQIADFYIKDGKVCAATIHEPADFRNLRVVISTSGYAGYIHKSVSLSCDTDYTISGSGVYLSMKAGEVFSTDAKGLYGADRLTIQPSGTGKIELKSVKRNWPGNQNPKYAGIIEIGLEKGGYSIVNEISPETYLYAVVPSEMPSSYGVTVSAVQAITARSYAYNQYFANRYYTYGANIDDSVSSQVYNNIPENETSIQAVNETKGQYLAYNGQVISANFYSTSSGITANSGEVWAKNTFPVETPVYLSSKKQYVGDYIDLSVEENAAAFFKNMNVDAYDSSFAWFRWNTEVTVAQLNKSINANIGARYDVNPNLIKTLQKDGRYRSRPIKSIGTLLDIEVVKRSTAGNLLQVKLIGTEAIVIVSTEYNIRLLLQPGVINRKDGTKVENYALMPSGFFVFDKTYSQNGNLSKITVYGGGNGHGVGMSQVGVKGMLDRGFSVQDVLAHYYQGTEIIYK